MATQPWTTVAQQWTPSGLWHFADRSAVRTLVGAASDQDLTAIVTDRLQRMARFYRQKLLDRFQKSYPNTTRQWLTLTTERLMRTQEYMSHLQQVLGVNDTQGVLSQLAPDLMTPNLPIPDILGGAFSSYLMIEHPRPPFPVNGPPTNGSSGTLAGIADNGDLCADMTAETMYVNRGTLASPIWVAWTTQSLVDYILNPQELLDAGYIRTLFYLQGYGSMMDNGDWDTRIKTIPTIAGITMKEALEAEALAFGIIKVDLSADGVLSDFEESMGEVSNWVF